ncbi:DUF4181 domain-containing protein [Bacillus sp. RO3]|nr:DUF4181 domain-containing protein [Bacillus sp. RO3]
MIQFLLFMLSVFILFFLAEQFVRNTFNIRKKEKENPNGVNSFHVWTKRILWTAIFMSVVFTSSLFLLTSLFVVLCGFNAFMEWRHNRSDREYVLSLLALALILFATIFGNLLYYYLSKYSFL